MPPTRGISCLSLFLYGIRIGGHSRLYMYSEERERESNTSDYKCCSRLPPHSRPDKHQILSGQQTRDRGQAHYRLMGKIFKLSFGRSLVGDFLFISCRHRLRLGLIKVWESRKFHEKRAIPSTVIKGSLSPSLFM